MVKTGGGSSPSSTTTTTTTTTTTRETYRTVSSFVRVAVVIYIIAQTLYVDESLDTLDIVRMDDGSI